MRGRRTDLGRADCAIARSLQVIGDWWSLLIVRESFLGAQRFGEFQRSLGLARNILSARLKKLVAEEILKIEPDDASAARHRYVLTAKGENLHVVLIALWQWGETACFRPGELNLTLVDNQHQVPLAPLEPKARGGKSIGPRDFGMARISGRAAGCTPGHTDATARAPSNTRPATRGS
jgi:DNA-binding HxlR family transcriptional regulator